jgi:hypothetical protein
MGVSERAHTVCGRRVDQRPLAPNVARASKGAGEQLIEHRSHPRGSNWLSSRPVAQFARIMHEIEELGSAVIARDELPAVVPQRVLRPDDL